MPRYRTEGFTWIETLSVLVIMAMLYSIAAPALSDALARYRLRDAGDTLLASLDRARATAIRRSHPVTVCPTHDGHACSERADWAGGWLGRDDTLNRLFDVADALDTRIGASRRASRDHIRFLENGTSPGTNQRITLCLRGKPATAFSLVTSNAGRARRDAAGPDETLACANAVSQKH